MMGKKKLAEIEAEVAALLGRLPGAPRAWLEKEIAAAKKNKHRDVETLQMLCAALEREVKKGRKPKARRTPTRR